MFSISGIFKTENKKCNFEQVQRSMQNDTVILINTLISNDQDCLIKGTLQAEKEEHRINDLIGKGDYKSHQIIVYGRNAMDPTVEVKYKQLVSIGFQEVYLYLGGMFEWMLLQDIYGQDEFPTTRRVLDILRYK